MKPNVNVDRKFEHKFGSLNTLFLSFCLVFHFVMFLLVLKRVGKFYPKMSTHKNLLTYAFSDFRSDVSAWIKICSYSTEES